MSCLQVTDYRTQFSKWWVSEWKAVAFPEKGLVFDYYVDETQVGTAPLRQIPLIAVRILPHPTVAATYGRMHLFVCLHDLICLVPSITCFSNIQLACRRKVSLRSKKHPLPPAVLVACV